jgi:cytochrome c oxidase subunit 3
MIQFALFHPERYFAGEPFPKWFFLSTVLILICSIVMERARKVYNQDNGTSLLNALLIVLGLGLLFSITQVLGWQQLWKTHLLLHQSDIGVVSNKNTSLEMAQHSSSTMFLYIISGLHLVHLLGGLVLLFIAMFKLVNVRNDQVKGMIYFSDRSQQTRINMLVLYWHFLDALWVILFLYFLWFFV